ncbi:MAG: SDR family NAD(P)-dependent oxidoreductase, partial [Anaerolineales bacterium]
MSAEPYSGRRALITGGLGFIGSNLAHYLVKHGATVTVVDSLDPRAGGKLANIEDIEEQVEVIAADIGNFDSVAGAVARCDVIYHCAAHTSHPYSMRDPQRDIEVNCIGTINVLEALRRFRPAAKMVYVGTSTQIGE